MITIKEIKGEDVKARTYPYIGKSRTNGDIVFFTSPRRGFSFNSHMVSKANDFWACFWEEQYFDVLPEITLKSE